MSEAVVIKSNKYGINLILDKDLPFDELLKAIHDKFAESADFFKNAKIAISFDGRTLTKDEECRIINMITEETDIEIICIVDDNEPYAERFRRQIELSYEPVSGNDGGFYRGTLRSGQILESASSIVIVGDVNPGAKIISNGNIVVLGALKGNAYAGASGNTDCFIVAMEMDPIQIQIGDVLAKSPDKNYNTKKKGRREKFSATIEPQIALAKGRNIYIDPLKKGSFNNI